MPFEMAVLLAIVSVIGTAIIAIRATVWWSRRHLLENEETLLNATELLRQQGLEAEIMIIISEANDALDRAISRVNSAPRITNTATLKASVLTVEKKSTALKQALKSKVLKTGGVHLFDPEPVQNGGNAANTGSAGSKINAALKALEPFKRVSFKEMMHLLRERDQSIKSIEDFQKLAAGRQDELLKSIVNGIAQKDVTGNPQGDLWTDANGTTTVSVITTPAA